MYWTQKVEKFLIDPKDTAKTRKNKLRHRKRA